MYAKLRPRRSTTTEWSSINPILKEGELGIECPDTGVGTGLCKFKIGDGRKKWNELPYAFDAAAANSINGGTPSVSHDILLRSGTTDDWETENPVLKYGEIVFDSTVYAFKCGDGEHTFKQLDYIGYQWQMLDMYNFGCVGGITDDGRIITPDTNIQPDDKDFDFGEA